MVTPLLLPAATPSAGNVFTWVCVYHHGKNVFLETPIVAGSRSTFENLPDVCLWTDLLQCSSEWRPGLNMGVVQPINTECQCNNAIMTSMYWWQWVTGIRTSAAVTGVIPSKDGLKFICDEGHRIYLCIIQLLRMNLIFRVHKCSWLNEQFHTSSIIIHCYVCKYPKNPKMHKRSSQSSRKITNFQTIQFTVM